MALPEIAARLEWLRAIGDPTLTVQWTIADWDRVVRLAHRHRLLARLACSLGRGGLMSSVPAAAGHHLVAARRVSEYRTRSMLWAVERLPRILGNPKYPLVLLKGSAYIVQNLSIAQGRLPSDLDILIPQAHLAEARVLLRQAGWHEALLDEQDRQYYLQWSHELPPMTHGQYAIELDVHHNILPPRAGQMVDAGLLFDKSIASRWDNWRVLSPVDQLLHSAAHLFFDSEPRDRVRDLVDLDGLFRHFAGAPGFWDDLPQRAAALGLLEPLALACHFTRAWLATPIPSHVQATVAARGPSPARRQWLIPLMTAVLMPSEPDLLDSIGKRLAATLVRARYHWHRLPKRVLVPHLWHKVRPWRSARPARGAAGTLR